MKLFCDTCNQLIHIPQQIFWQCLLWMRYSKFQIWPWKFIVKVMARVKSHGHIWGIKFNRYICFVSWQLDHFLSRYSRFHISPWIFKVKTMAKVKAMAKVKSDGRIFHRSPDAREAPSHKQAPLLRLCWPGKGLRPRANDGAMVGPKELWHGGMVDPSHPRHVH